MYSSKKTSVLKPNIRFFHLRWVWWSPCSSPLPLFIKVEFVPPPVKTTPDPLVGANITGGVSSGVVCLQAGGRTGTEPNCPLRPLGPLPPPPYPPSLPYSFPPARPLHHPFMSCKPPVCHYVWGLFIFIQKYRRQKSVEWNRFMFFLHYSIFIPYTFRIACALGHPDVQLWHHHHHYSKTFKKCILHTFGLLLNNGLGTLGLVWGHPGPHFQVHFWGSSVVREAFR